MSDEPNQKMDELLKAYARKRRAETGGPPTLHPANRRLLQAEVARLRPNPSVNSQPWLAMWRTFGARFALGTSMLLLLGVGSWLWLRTLQPPEQPAKFAKVAKPEADLQMPPVPAQPLTAEPAPPERLLQAQQSPELAKKKMTEARSVPAGAPLQSAQELPAPQGPRPNATVAVRDKDQTSPESSPAARNFVDRGRAAESLVRQQNLARNKNEAAGYAQNDLRLASPTANAPALLDQQVGARTERTQNPSSPVALGDVDSANQQSLALSAPANIRAPAAFSLGGQSPTAQSLDLFPLLTGGVLSQSDPRFNAGFGLSTNATINPFAAGASLNPGQRLAGEERSDVALRVEKSDDAVNSLASARPLNSSSRERFVRLASGSTSPARKKSSDAKAAVLASFDLEQTGEQMRVVDGDGSVYEGRVSGAALGQTDERKAVLSENAPPARPAEKEADTPRAVAINAQQVAGAAVSSLARSFSFRVSGTNRTLRAPVVLEGVLWSAPEGATNLAVTGRLQGKLRIGTTNEVPLEAVRTVPSSR